MKSTGLPKQMVVALDLTVALKTFYGKVQDEEEEEDEGHEIWSEHQSIRLDSTLWQNLPSDLIFNFLLVHLPFLCLLRLRCVSRSWHTRLSSPAFWRSWFCHNRNAKPSSELALQSISNINAHGLNPNPNMRRNLHIPHLLLCSASPPAFLYGYAARRVKQKSVKYVRSRGSAPYKGWFRLHENSIQMQEPYTILTSEKGLLLLALRSRESEKLLVCNPLLRQQKVLPIPTSVMGISAARFFVDGESGDYAIILDDCQVYHSKLGKWQVIHHAGDKSALPALLDGSIFWLSQQQLSGSSDLPLFAYHPSEGIVTSVQTQFPPNIFFPEGGLVWKDSKGLQTLASDPTWFGVWKFDGGVWKKLKKIWDGFGAVSKLSYVKVGNVFFMNELGCNQFFVFNLEHERCAWQPCCPLSLCLMGHCAFKPSYFGV